MQDMIVTALVVAIALIAPTSALADGEDRAVQDCFVDADFASSHPGCTTTDANYQVTAMALSPDERFLYTASFADNAITTYSRDATGQLAVVGCVSEAGGDAEPACATRVPELGRPHGIAISPDGRNLYVAGYELSAVISFARDPSTGALTYLGCVSPLSGYSCAFDSLVSSGETLVVSADGESLYAAGGHVLSTLDRDPATGALSAVACIDDADLPRIDCAHTEGLAGITDLAISPDGKTVYTAASGQFFSEFTDAIAAFARAADGTLTPIGCVNDPGTSTDTCATASAGLTGVNSLAVSPDNRNLYAGSGAFSQGMNGDDAIVAFGRDLSTGGLTPAGCVENVGAGSGCAASGDLQYVTALAAVDHVWAAARWSDPALVRLGRDGTTGALTPEPCNGSTDPNFCNMGLSALQGYGSKFFDAITVSSDERSVYTAGEVALVEWAPRSAFATTTAAIQEQPSGGVVIDGSLDTPAPGVFDISAVVKPVLVEEGSRARRADKPGTLKFKLGDLLASRDEDPAFRLANRSKVAKKLVRAIRKGRLKATAKVTVVGTDFSGNVSKQKARVKLR